MRMIKAEFLKSKRKFVFSSLIMLLAVNLFWVFYTPGEPDAEFLREGWMMLLYQFPIINSIVMPLMTALLASRICDGEHRGNMFKQLCTYSSRGALFNSKFLYGVLLVLLYNLIQLASMFIYGYICGFEGNAPLGLYLTYFGTTFFVCITLFMLQLDLSLVFKNQAVSLSVGLLGMFVGLIALFLPQFPWIRASVPWGYFGEFITVGSMWTKENPINSFYYMGFSIPALFRMAAMFIVFYAAGRFMFERKEL